MITNLLLATSTLILIILSLYGVNYLFVILLYFFTKNKSLVIDKRSSESVTILIASYNEGEALVDTINTLLAQDYQGKVFIKVLIKDKKDTSFKFLKNSFNLNNSLIYTKDNFTFECVLTGLQFKNDKINYALKSLESDYVAFLDADHRAHPLWIESSVFQLSSSSSVAIQSKRGPMDARKLFQFWDSAQNHLGNEVFNAVFKKLGLTSFFTGTTCLFKSSVFAKRGFPDSITEDTYLSYQLLTEGEKIDYNPYYGSFEEVAPDLYTYIARRRRWSSGHNQTFFDHLTKLFSKGSFFRKLQLLFHGGYFLLPTLIVLLLNCFGFYIFVQLTTNLKLLSVFSALIFSVSFSVFISGRTKELIQNILFSFFWFFPQFSIVSVFIYKLMGDELYYQILTFPYVDDFKILHVVLILIPLVLLFFGSLRIKNPSPKFYFIYLLTFPIILFIDIYSFFIGFIDFLFKRKIWGRIKRANTVQVESLPTEIQENIVTTSSMKSKYLWFLILPFSLVSLVVVNDLLVFPNCGNPKYLLSRSLVFDKVYSSKTLNLQFKKKTIDANNFLLKTNVLFAQDDVDQTDISYSINSSTPETKIVSTKKENIEFSTVLPMGFETTDITVTLKGGGEGCSISKKISTSVKEVKNGKLYLNNEPFLIKGLIPSFRTAQVNLDYETGLKQFKELGVNTIRTYHAPTKELQDLARKYSMMIVDQPDETTWKNIKMEDDDSVTKLTKRYKGLIKSTEGNPYILLDNLGNELAISVERNSAVKYINDTLLNIKKKRFYRYPISYSTYFTYEDFSSDILAVNMLDTGKTYWRDGLSLVKKKNKAYFASEFGGFVAFYERPRSLVRISRFVEYWNRLIQYNSLGAIFYQSHDNWAQPVPVGYNDPLSAEHPDDIRGVWDHKNRPKFEYNYLKKIYNDFEVVLKKGFIQIRNIREFGIANLIVDVNGKVSSVGLLKPDESYSIPVSKKQRYKIRFEFTTHKGLMSTYTQIVNNYNDAHDLYSLNDYHIQSKINDGYYIDVFKDNYLKLAIPRDWTTISVNGKNFAAKPLLKIPFSLPWKIELRDTYVSFENGAYRKFKSNLKKGGQYQIRVQFSQKIKNLKYYQLVLRGIGANAIEITDEKGLKTPLSVHNYRDVRIDLRKLSKYDDQNYIIIKVLRDQIEYVNKSFTPDGVPIMIDFELPTLELINSVVVKRVD